MRGSTAARQVFAYARGAYLSIGVWLGLTDVPFIDIPSSPLVPGAQPVRIHYRDAGQGAPIVVLHGGWGYEAYPFDRQIAALSAVHRVVIPDRSGYGRSPAIDDLPPDFHHRAGRKRRRWSKRPGRRRRSWGGPATAPLLRCSP